MIGMSEAIAPVSVGMEFPLPLAPIGGESIEFVKSSHIPPMPKDIPQWEPFKEYSQSLPLVAKELGDRMEGKNVGPHVSRDRGRVVCASLPVFEVKQPETPVREVSVDFRVEPLEVKESLPPETPRINKPEIAQTEAPRIAKPEYIQVNEFEKPVREIVVASRVTSFEVKETIAPETPRVDKLEISQSEAPRIEKPEYTQVKEFETPVKDVAVASRVTSSEVKEPIAIETPRIDKPEISQTEAPRINKPEIAQTEAPRIEKPEYTQVKEFETPVKDVAVASRVTSSEVKEPIAIETPRVDKPEISQLETPRTNKPEIAQTEAPSIEKPEYTQVKEFETPVKDVAVASRVTSSEVKEPIAIEIPRVDKPEISQSEAPRIEKPEYTQVKEFETPVKDVAVASRVTPFEAKETIAPETPRVDKPEISQLEAPRINKPEMSQTEMPRVDKPEYVQVKEFEYPVKESVVASHIAPSEVKETLTSETTRINKPEISQSEAPRIEKPDHSQLKEIEKPVKEVLATSLAPANEKPEVTLVDIASARVSQNTVVQTPESAVVSRLVETVVETLAVTPTLSSTGEGEIHIKLKSDILDGSSIKIEVKNGELKVVVEPASRAAEEILIKSQEAFQNQLAERVTAWRINVGVATLDLRNNLKRKLEELS